MDFDITNCIDLDAYWNDEDDFCVQLMNGNLPEGDRLYFKKNGKEAILCGVELLYPDLKIPEKVIDISSREMYTVTEIGENAFRSCNKLKSVTLPDTITRIGKCAFAMCSDLEEVHMSNVRFIGELAFSRSPKLRCISLPETVSHIGDGAFQECMALSEVFLPSSAHNIGECVFWGCPVLTTVRNYSGERIESFAFFKCGSLREVEITSTVHSIESFAFYNCGSLKTIHIPQSVKIIGEGVFVSCGFEAITIPDSVTVIGQQSFLNCTHLKSVSLSNSMTDIPSKLFLGCTSLTQITIPEKVSIINDHAFADCSRLEKVTLSRSLTKIITGAFKRCTRLCEISNFKDSVTLEEGVFEGCDKLDKHVLPFNQYDSQADSTLAGDPFGCAEMTEINLPDDMDHISSGTFADYGQLRKINIPKTVRHIEGGAFLGCFQLVDVELNGNPYFCFEEGILYYTGKDQDEWNIVHVAQCTENFTVSRKVTGILSYAFSKNNNLTTIVIPKECLSIGNNAFEGCPNLQEVVIEDKTRQGKRKYCSHLRSIAPNMFRGCANLNKVYLPGCITSISENAFNGCKSLRAIVLPTHLQFIGEGAFANCSALKKIIIPESVSEIHDDAFWNCSSLTEVTINSLYMTHFGERVFANCSLLNSIDGSYGYNNITIHNNVIYSYGLKILLSAPCAKGRFVVPDFVKTIGRAAFCGCLGLTKAILPESACRIETDAFRGCSNLSVVDLPGVRYVEKGAFTDCVSLREIRIPNEDAIRDWKERPRTDLLKVHPVPSKATPKPLVADITSESMTRPGSPSIEEELRKMSYDYNKRVVIQSVFQRNKQHNLGSHVNALFAHPDFVKSFDPAKELNRFVPLFHKEKTAIETDREILLSKQIEYGNLRDSFCTDIMSGAPVTRSAITIRNLITEFEANRILLNYIAKDSFRYRFQVFFDDEQTPADPYPTTNPDTGETITTADERWDHLISMPNDNFGCQAFYNFLENIIRNTAKYTNYESTIKGNGDNFQGVTICIRFKNSKDKRFYTVEVYSNVLQKNLGAIVRKQNKYIQEPVVNPDNNRPRTDAKGLIEMASCTAYLRGKDVIAIDSKDYKFIGNTLAENDERRNIYNECSEPVFLKAFGLATEESVPKPEYASIFSAFVNKIKKWGDRVTRNQITIPTCTVFDSKAEKHTCVHLSDMEIENGTADDYDGFLGYRFFLLKPEQVLVVVGGSGSKDTKKLAGQLAGHKGVEIVSVDELRSQLGKGVPVFHDILVCDDMDLIEQYSALLPIRVLPTNILQEMDLSGNSDQDHNEDDPIVVHCWKKWVDYIQPDIRAYGTYYNDCLDKAYFDDHINSGTDSFEIAMEKAGYAEALSSNAQQHLPDYEANAWDAFLEKNNLTKYFNNINKEKGIAHYRLLESINTRILIVDEHIKLESDTIPSLGVKNTITYRKHWKTCRIDLPEDDLIWNSSEGAAKILNIIGNAMERRQYDFILIHLELLEGAFELLHPDDKENHLCQYIKSISQDKFTQVVFKSGRGVPGYLPASVRFMQQTSAENALVETKSKYLFTSLLHNSRAVKGN